MPKDPYKIFLSFCLFLCLYLQGNAQAPLQIFPLTKDFYIFTTFNYYKGNPVPSNGMYMVTTSGVVLVDTPWDTTQFQPLLDSIWSKHHKKVVLCLSTHFHADRTAGLEYYRKKGIRTYSSQFTRQLCREHKEKEAEKTFLNDTLFTVGNHILETYYPGPGHSPDNIVVWIPDEKILYGGCFIKSTEARDLGNLSDANPTAWAGSMRNTVRKFEAPVYVIPGHQSWKDPRSCEHTINLLEAYSRGVQKK